MFQVRQAAGKCEKMLVWLTPKTLWNVTSTCAVKQDSCWGTPVDTVNVVGESAGRVMAT